jgi:hypothetical protein
MKNIATLDFLTSSELERVHALWRELKGSGRFATEVEGQVIAPNIARITAALGEEHDATSVSYIIENALSEGEPQAPGYLWRWVEDVCQVCGCSSGHTLRFMHLGLCGNARTPRCTEIARESTQAAARNATGARHPDGHDPWGCSMLLVTPQCPCDAARKVVRRCRKAGSATRLSE